MPFDTEAGPAVLIENICDVPETAKRLGVHVNSIYNWARNRDETEFPAPMPFIENPCYDYAQVYDWFQDWVKTHPRYYPKAFIALMREEAKV